MWEVMPKARRRLTIDVSELAERVENCRDDLAWQSLSLSAKIRVLIETALTAPEPTPQPQEGAAAALIALIAAGGELTPAAIAQAALAADVSPQELSARLEKLRNGNGEKTRA